MKIIAKVIPFILLSIAVILTVMLIIQVSEIFTKDSNFLFFQIIFSFVWGMGASIFWVLGLISLRSGKGKEEEQEQEETL